MKSRWAVFAGSLLPRILYKVDKFGTAKLMEYMADEQSEFCLNNFPYNSKCACGKINFIRCAYCDNFVCFDHFIVTNHVC